MNYETEFELEAMLYPITRDEHVAAAKAIIAERVKRLHAERGEVDVVTNQRVRELALGGIEAEVKKLAAVSDAINARVEETQTPRRGRPKGSKTKPKTEEAVVDVTQHSEEFCRECGMGGDRCICEEAKQQ